MELWMDKSKVFSGSVELDKAEIIILGVPYDSGAVSTPGQRYAPQAIRNSLEQFEPGYNGKPLPEIHDLGDLSCGPEFPVMRKRLADTVSRIRKKFVALGGDHSISLPIIEALKPKRVVCFDAHCDSRDEYLGSRYNSATVMKRVSEICETIIVNARQKFGGKCLGEDEFEPKNFKDCYLSIDIDVLDPSIAPGTGTPVPLGMSLEKLISLTSKLKPVAVDIVEVNPLVEKRVTPSVAAFILMHALSILK